MIFNGCESLLPLCCVGKALRGVLLTIVYDVYEFIADCQNKKDANGEGEK